MQIAAFIIVSALLWATVFGYPLALIFLARLRRVPDGKQVDRDRLPSVAVIVPTLDEEKFVRSKIDDLMRTEYPTPLLSVVVADGGSRDRTVEIARRMARECPRLEVRSLTGATGKADQINRVVSTLEQEIVVVTDADTRLNTDCISELVRMLEADPNLSVVGATIVPATDLLEEQIHWAIQNRLWWLEGEAVGASAVGAPCYAIRNNGAPRLALDTIADDVHLALAAGSRGDGARISRSAVAMELRVPQTVGEFLEYRTRRGSQYLNELGLARSTVRTWRWKCMVLFRRWLFWSLAPLLVSWLMLGVVALTGESASLVLVTMALFGVSAALVLQRVLKQLGSAGKYRVVVATLRYCTLICRSLFYITTLRLQGDTNGAAETSEYNTALPESSLQGGTSVRSASALAERL